MLTALPLTLALLAAEPTTEAEKAAAPTVALQPGMIRGQAPFLVGAVSQNPYFFGGLALDGGWIVALGLGLSYDSAKTADPTTFFAVLHAEWMAVNKANFAFGPELTLIIPFLPAVANPLTVAPGLAFWYAPFSAPVLLGAALDVNLNIGTGSTPTFSLGTVTPGVRLAYVF